MPVWYVGTSLFILSDCCQGGEEICKQTPETGVFLHIWVKLSLRLCSTELFASQTSTWLIWKCVFFPTAGSFLLMRQANWRRETYQIPCSLQHTTASYRQTPQRAKYDAAGPVQASRRAIPSTNQNKTLRNFSFVVLLMTRWCLLVRVQFDAAPCFVHQMFITPTGFIFKS